MDTRWQHSPDHLWLSICVQLAVLIKYSLSLTTILSIPRSPPQTLGGAPRLGAETADPTDPVRILRWKDFCQLRLGRHLGEDVVFVVY